MIFWAVWVSKAPLSIFIRDKKFYQNYIWQNWRFYFNWKKTDIIMEILWKALGFILSLDYCFINLVIFVSITQVAYDSQGGERVD